MMTAKVEESVIYKMFEFDEVNRDVVKIKELMASMKKHGWIDSKPMSVRRNGSGKLMIYDGHHRFEVAQRLGIPVKYVVDTGNATMYDLDKPTNKWSMLDCLTSYCRANKIEYQKVKFYCDETGISLSNAASMLAGETAGSGNYYEAFRRGTYKVNQNSNHAGIVKDLTLCLKKAGVKFYSTSLLTLALSRIVRVEGFDVARMKSKIKAFSYIIEKKANLDQYLEMIEEVYNRQSQQKIPLKYMAIEATKARAVAASFKRG